MKEQVGLFDRVDDLLQPLRQIETPVVPGATTPTRFDGPAYVPAIDKDRLGAGLQLIFELMKDQRWRSLDEISTMTKVPAASVSADLRHLRKDRFGAHQVDKRRRDGAGLWEYRLIPNVPK